MCRQKKLSNLSNIIKISPLNIIVSSIKRQHSNTHLFIESQCANTYCILITDIYTAGFHQLSVFNLFQKSVLSEVESKTSSRQTDRRDFQDYISC